MTKTKRNILLTMLSFVMAICALFLSTMPSMVAKADSTCPELCVIEEKETEFVFDTSNYVVEGVIQDWSEIIEKPVRLYADSFLEITGYNGAYLMSSFNGFSFMVDDYSEPEDAPVEIYTCSGVDEKGEYVDIYFTREALLSMFGSSEEIMVYASEVYSLNEVLPELPDGPVEEPSDKPNEAPDNNGQEMNPGDIILFSVSGLVLVVVVAFVISLFKKKNRR